MHFAKHGRQLLISCATLALIFSQRAFPQQAETPPIPEQTVATDSPESMFPHFRDTRFWLSGQTNFIFQTHTDFHARYSGPHSLQRAYDKATSRLLTLYTGYRLNNSTELLADLEEAGGSALSAGFGL